MTTAALDSGNEIDFDYSPSSIDYDSLDATPEEYRNHLIRLMAIQAYSEEKASTESTDWIAKAPDYKRRRVLAKVIAEEARHSYLVYQILERIGIGEKEAIAIAEGRSGQRMHDASLEGPLSVGHAENDWIDIMLNHMFLDRAGKFMVSNFCEASFKPWADANKVILREEKGHIGFGYAELRAYLSERGDTEEARNKVSNWYAKGLNFFGPPSTKRGQLLANYGLKRLDNEQLRTAFREEVEAVFDEWGRRDLIELSSNEFPYR